MRVSSQRDLILESEAGLDDPEHLKSWSYLTFCMTTSSNGYLQWVNHWPTKHLLENPSNWSDFVTQIPVKKKKKHTRSTTSSKEKIYFFPQRKNIVKVHSSH